jgi:hypothetical protein
MAITMNEGWCTDPFELHEARWISAGTPTKLVRDGAVESYEAVPAVEATATAIPLHDPSGATHGADLLRSDRAIRDQRAAMNRAASRILVHTCD